MLSAAAKTGCNTRWLRIVWVAMALFMAGAIPAASAGPIAAAPTRADPAQANGAREVVFIDNALANHETLINAIGAGVEVQIIGSDGLAQMAQWARSHRGYGAIHVVSHGAPGAIILGADALDDSLLSRSEVRALLARIGHALRRDGDLLVYGCRVAEGERGRAFVRKLAAATGAHVAASTDPTGSARLGGDWTLEYVTAENSTRPLAEPGYDALLGAGTITYQADGITRFDGTTFGADGIVTDGEFGSTDVADIVVQIAAIDGSSAILTGDHLAFHSDDWFVPAIVTWDDGVSGATHGMVIQSADGSEFQLNGFSYVNWGEGGTVTIQVRGYRDTDEVASASFDTANNGGWQTGTATLGSSFDNVDQVILYYASPSWHGINGIVIADAVSPPTTTITGASLSADTGYSNTDWITSTALQAISGTLSANLVSGEKVQVSYDNGAHWSDATSTEGTDTWSATTTLAGSNTFRARVYSASGFGTVYTHAYVLDQTAPTVVSVTRLSPATAVTKDDTLVFQVTFGEALANLRNASTGDFAVSGTTAIVTSVNTADVDSYNVTVSGGNLASLNGTVTLTFSAGQNIVDLAGNALNTTVTGTNNNTYTLDNTGPTITSIVRQNPAASITNANSVIFRVTFDETAANVDNADFAASGTTAAASVSAVAGTTYDVTLSGGNLASLNGTVSLGLAGGQDITDAVSNALTNTTPTGTNESYTVDNTAPGGCVGALSVAENAANGTAVGTVSATDAVSYTLTDTAGGRFAISAVGAVTVNNGSLLDYESATSHSITIRATDAAGNISDTNRTVTITNVNDVWPVITEGAGPLAVTLSEDSSPTPFAQTLHATDADGATTFTWTISSAASHGTAAASGTGSAKDISYVPNSNYNGSDSFTVRVSDGINTDSVQINVTIEAVNDAPIINQGDSTSFTTAEDTSHDLTLTGTEVDGQAMTWSLSAAPAHGGVGFAGGAAASKTFTYTPAANYNGSDSFEVRLSDGSLTDTITVNVTVNAANDPPAITEGASTSFTIAEDAAHTVDLHATDPEGQAVSWSVTSGPSHGDATVPTGTGTSKSITYTPAANYHGADSFVVTASDGTATDTITVNVTITAVDDAPAITQGASTTLTVLEDSNEVLALTVTEADGEAVTWGVDVVPTHGGVVLPAGTGLSKNVTYTPDADYSGADGFRATATDGHTTDTIDVSATVLPVNDEPSFTPGANVAIDSDSGAAHVEAGWATSLSAGAANEASQTLTFVASNDNNALFTVQPNVDATGALRFTPVASAAGTATVTLYLADDGGTANGGDDRSPSVTFDITLTSTAIPAPVFTPAGGTFKGRVEVTLTAATPGAVIRYTTDSTTPSETHGKVVASGTTILLYTDAHLAAIAYASGRPHSAITEADYVIKHGGGALGFGALFALGLLALRRRLPA